MRVIHDFSKYGTQSCWGDCGRYRSKFLSELKKLNLTSVYYDPVDYPSFPRSLTFAAFVEREYLSTSDVLVTAGHGGFQTILVEQFLHSISTGCVSYIKQCLKANLILLYFSMLYH